MLNLKAQPNRMERNEEGNQRRMEIVKRHAALIEDLESDISSGWLTSDQTQQWHQWIDELKQGNENLLAMNDAPVLTFKERRMQMYQRILEGVQREIDEGHLSGESLQLRKDIAVELQGRIESAAAE